MILCYNIPLVRIILLSLCFEVCYEDRRVAGGLSPERNVSLSTGTMVTEALRGQGHRAALVDLYFGLEDDAGALEELFDADVSAAAKRISRQAPDLEQVKAARRDKSPSLFGPNVLELCRAGGRGLSRPSRRRGEDGRVQAAFDLLGIPYTGAGYLAAPSPWIRT